MKGMFPEYDDTSSIDFDSVWKNAVFIFDTNILLNLYRYQLATRDELLSILEDLSKQVWIPHHVALEFQKNRQNVIADQNKRFNDVRDTLEKTRKNLINDFDKLQLKKRHSAINPDEFINDFNRLADEFINELTSAQKNQQQLTGPDPLKQKIEELFAEKVGPAPLDQKEIDGIYKIGEERFKLNRPPGFKDAGKDKDRPDEHFHGGITYKSKYGDFLIWMQILAHAKNRQWKTLIFVTDDGKEDWWARIGHHTIGPRPELIDEAKHSSAITTFLMYSLETFLNAAKSYLNAQVSEETLQEIRDISITSNQTRSLSIFPTLRLEALQLLEEYLRPNYDELITNNFWPDIIAMKNGRKYGFELVEVKGNYDNELANILKEYIQNFQSEVDDATLVILVKDVATSRALAAQMLRIPKNERVIKDIYIMIVAMLDRESLPNSLLICAEFDY